MSVGKRSLTAQDYIEILLRGKWWILFPVLAGTLIATVYSYSLPSFYRSSTLIMIERQKAPEAYVQATVQDRLNTINEQILSRNNLEQIITQLNLAEEEPNAPPQGGTIEHMLATTSRQLVALLSVDAFIEYFNFLESVKPLVGHQTVPIGTDEIISRLRNNIEVKVIGKDGKDAFMITSSGQNPSTVMNTTNLLASLFIEENLKAREREAIEFSQFLENDLKAAESELNVREKNLREFKSKHMGALPDQLDVNLRNLDRLRSDLKSINESLKKSSEMLEDLESGNITNKLSFIDGQLQAKMNPIITKYEALVDELSRLQAEYNDNYPDIMVLKNQIHDLEISLKEGLSSDEPPRRPGSFRPQRVQSRAQTIKSELETLRLKQKETMGQIREFERRVEETFPNEQILSSLVRDYDGARGNYGKLLEKSRNAKSSENLEKWQKDERFKILDTANLPEKPYKPDRQRIILLGAILGAGFGGGIIFLKEYRNAPFRKPEDFYGITDVSTLALIPRNNLDWQKDQQITGMKEPHSIVSDQYRILFARINQLNKEYGQTVFAISSSIKGEGKTLTSLNLAIVAARDFGKKTLLIEGDFKNPTISRNLHANPNICLVDILLNKSDIQPSLVSIGYDNLSILPIGRGIKNSSSLLSSQSMKDLIMDLRELYDIIFIDSPPILPLPDMNIIEGIVDSIILVVKAESTQRSAVSMAIESLSTQKLTGIVLNDVRKSPSQYRQYEYGKL